MPAQTMSDDDRAKLALLLLLSFERKLPLIETGSQVIGGATEESDWDYIMLCERFNRSIDSALTGIGFVSQTETEDQYGNRMTYKTYRCGKLNLVICRTKESFNLWHKATELAKSVRPQTKAQRIQIFDAVFGVRVRPMYILDDQGIEEVDDDF